MKNVEIFAIGNELLRGIVAESNAHWLAKRIAARGASLQRVTVLPDDITVVANEIRAALGRTPDLLVTHGGLGPTDDDRTREMIAVGIGVPQELDETALSIVRRRYRELHAAGVVDTAELDDARARMACVPRRAQAFDNEIGAAPAFAVAAGSTTIVALPGVPPELWWIWENPMAPFLDDLLGPGGFAEETLHLDLRDESRIAYLLKLVQEEHQRVYVKSRAHGFEEGDDVRVTLASTAESDDAARAAVVRASSDLRAALGAEGISIRS